MQIESLESKYGSQENLDQNSSNEKEFRWQRD